VLRCNAVSQSAIAQIDMGSGPNDELRTLARSVAPLGASVEVTLRRHGTPWPPRTASRVGGRSVARGDGGAA